MLTEDKIDKAIKKLEILDIPISNKDMLYAILTNGKLELNKHISNGYTLDTVNTLVEDILNNQ